MLGTIVLVILVFLVAFPVVQRLVFFIVMRYLDFRMRRDVELWQKKRHS